MLQPRRTHQLNTTGRTYSLEELRACMHSPHYRLLVASLDDNYGSYGKIGLALIETGSEVWNIRLLLMSCRVVTRGVGTILLNLIMQQAKDAGAKLRADFAPNGRNRMMLITYRFAGFKEIERSGGIAVMESPIDEIQPAPPYVTVEIG